MIPDRDKLWQELDQRPLEDVRKAYDSGAFAPAAKANLVKLYIETKDEALQRAERAALAPAVLPDAFGRDLEGDQKRFEAELEKAGVEQVRGWHARIQPKDDPLKWKWMDDWLGVQAKKKIEDDDVYRAVRDAKLDAHNALTRRIAMRAVIVSAISMSVAAGALYWSYYSWSHPRSVPDGRTNPGDPVPASPVQLPGAASTPASASAPTPPNSAKTEVPRKLNQ